MARNKATKKQWIIGSIIVVVGGAGLGLVLTHFASDGGDAYVMCQQLASDKLRDPSSTDWPYKADSVDGPDATGNYVVAMHGTSNNGFGGKTRFTATCYIRDLEDGRDGWQGSISLSG